MFFRYRRELILPGCSCTQRGESGYRTNTDSSGQQPDFKGKAHEGGRWNRENWHRETIKIVGTDLARPDNAAPED